MARVESLRILSRHLSRDRDRCAEAVATAITRSVTARNEVLTQASLLASEEAAAGEAGYSLASFEGWRQPERRRLQNLRTCQAEAHRCESAARADLTRAVSRAHAVEQAIMVIEQRDRRSAQQRMQRDIDDLASGRFIRGNGPW